MRELKLKSHYDLVIVGGGIQGCAMLWEAQSRGLNSLLVEAQDYCSQTSANSLKTIHGGIRYLQSLNLSRTQRSAKEQETLLNIAPHLVRPLPCILPTERKLKRSRLAVTAGFGTYNLIKKLACHEQKLPKARYLSKKKLNEITDLLDCEKVTGAGFWYDAQVQHAERLGLAFIKTARESGADAYNYLKADSFSATHHQQFELTLKCQISTQKHKLTADSLVYCTSSSTNETLPAHRGGLYPNFCLAVNLVLKSQYAQIAVGLQCGFAEKISHGSSRLLFAAPWRSSTLFGTWYFEQENEVNEMPSKQQIEFCLNDINQTYPKADYKDDDVVAVHAGMLPVAAETSAPENNLMELDLIDKPDDHDNLFVVIPSKYTTCRATAQQTIDRIVSNMSSASQKSVSSKMRLVGAKDIDDIESFLAESQHKYQPLFSEKMIQQLVENYGDQIDKIAELCRQRTDLVELIPGTDDHIKAQLEYELEFGQVQNTVDFIYRRSFLAADATPDRLTYEYCDKRIDQFHSKY